MSVPSNRLLIASRRWIYVAGKAPLLQSCAICLREFVAISQLMQRTAIRELLKSGRKKILRGHLPGRNRIDRATGDPLTAERIPGKIDRRQPDGGDVVGQRLVIDAGDDSLSLPSLR